MEGNNRQGRYASAPKKKRSRRAQRHKRLIIILISVNVFLIGLIIVMLQYVNAAQNFKVLADQVQISQTTQKTEEETIEALPTFAQNDPIFPQSTDSEVEISSPPADMTVPTTETELAVKIMLPQYTNLYVKNTELYGWIRIDDTVIDYPVMRSVEEPEKYLHANFMAEYSYPGTPFVDYQCSNDSDNLLIYGHNMLDGSMFRSLIEYENKHYWEAHPTIMYSDLYGEYEYEVMAAFYDRVYKKSENCFKFYQFIDAEDHEDFTNAVNQFKEKSIYDTGINAQYGDQLITLITCAYHVENGRFVVVARKSNS